MQVGYIVRYAQCASDSEAPRTNGAQAGRNGEAFRDRQWPHHFALGDGVFSSQRSRHALFNLSRYAFRRRTPGCPQTTAADYEIQTIQVALQAPSLSNNEGASEWKRLEDPSDFEEWPTVDPDDLQAIFNEGRKLRFLISLLVKAQERDQQQQLDKVDRKTNASEERQV